MEGNSRQIPFEAIQALDVVMRHLPDRCQFERHNYQGCGNDKIMNLQVTSKL
jgi:hypothetical protein